MSFNDYLHQLKKGLVNLPQQKQEEILREITSHIEEGVEDASLGNSAEKRITHLKAELGPAGQMIQGFRRNHFGDRLIDFLLIFIPVYLLFPLVQAFLLQALDAPLDFWQNPTYQYFLSGCVIFGILLALFGIYRHSQLLKLFWVSDSLCRMISLMTREQRWSLAHGTSMSGVLGDLFGYILVIGLALWLLQILSEARDDLMLVYFGLSSLILTAVNVASVAAGVGSLGGASPTVTSTLVQLNTILSIVSLAAFCVATHRFVRWAALGLGEFSFTSLNIYMYHSPVVASIWALQFGVFVFFWFMEMRTRTRAAN
jgi:hypothetical protein